MTKYVLCVNITIDFFEQAPPSIGNHVKLYLDTQDLS